MHLEDDYRTTKLLVNQPTNPQPLDDIKAKLEQLRKVLSDNSNGSHNSSITEQTRQISHLLDQFGSVGLAGYVEDIIDGRILVNWGENYTSWVWPDQLKLIKVKEEDYDDDEEGDEDEDDEDDDNPEVI